MNSDGQNANNSDSINDNVSNLVIAKYEFNGRNNDELTFGIGDVITVIQRLDDGGWWEGTLNGSVGWFPKDFVGNVVNPHSKNSTTSRNQQQQQQINGITTTTNKIIEFDANKILYRKEIISNYLDSEREHYANLKTFFYEILASIDASHILTKEEYSIICSNISKILELKKLLLLLSEEHFQKPIENQQFGKIFLDLAPEMYSLLKFYCENHCLSVEIIDRKRVSLTKFLAAKNLELKDLISGLSIVFRHLKKYIKSLQEIERNTPDAHFDRGNLQRACVVYQDLYEYCEFIRKQKEAQREFISGGFLQENLGKDYEKMLGEFLYIGKVAIPSNENDNESSIIDRCIAVFYNYILLFEAITTSNNYALRNRISTQDLIMFKEKLKLTIYFRKKSKDLLTVKALTNEDFERLIESFTNSKNVQIIEEKLLENSTNASIKNDFDMIDAATSEANIFHENATTSKKLFNEASSSNFLRFDHELEMILPEGIENEQSLNNKKSQQQLVEGNSNRHSHRTKLYSGWSLRPIPSTRGEYLPGSASGASIKLRKGLSPEEQEDALMLKIVEGYCCGLTIPLLPHNSNVPWYSNRGINHGSTSTTSIGLGNMISGSPAGGGGPVRRAASYPDEAVRPQLIVAEDEKIFVEEMEDGQMVIKERSLVDTVYLLKDQLTILQKEVTEMTKKLENEQKSRRRLEELIRRTSVNLSAAPTPKPSNINIKEEEEENEN